MLRPVSDPRYEAWTAAFVARHKNFVRGRCGEATREMVAEFPELRRACGFVFCLWGEDTHWWCVAPDGSVVDPTVAQFDGIVPSYEEVDPKKPHRPLPTGPCATCRDYVYDGTMFCSPSCAREFVRDLGLSMGSIDLGPPLSPEEACQRFVSSEPPEEDWDQFCDELKNGQNPVF